MHAAALSPLAAQVLNVLARLAPNHLPCFVLAGPDDDEQTVDEALVLLASYSLITLATRSPVVAAPARRGRRW
ncbi:hypothetical protein ACIBHY_28525 [Nonomuraea sp. NPDC050547]|uniref:hypothetical protein n=1 Tax=Nonomuraea sp. NPDC050547 TaxID=3364368 RepID=UPI0037A9A755